MLCHLTTCQLSGADKTTMLDNLPVIQQEGKFVRAFSK